MKGRPTTTLFLLTSVDGKISTGATDNLDVDQDFPKIEGVSEGLHQYYEIEETTDLWSLSSGKVQAKVGLNEIPFRDKRDVSFVIIDNDHLNAHGIEYLARISKTFVLVTTNPEHIAFKMERDDPELMIDAHIIYQPILCLTSLLEQLHHKFGCNRVTIQSGSTLNGLFLRAKLIDYVDFVVAPILIGGKDTPMAIGGDSIPSPDYLSQLGVLKLLSCDILAKSYVRMRYKSIEQD